MTSNYQKNSSELVFEEDEQGKNNDLDPKESLNYTSVYENSSFTGIENLRNVTATGNKADQVYAISNAVSIVFIIVVVLVIFLWRRYQRNKKKLKKLTKEEVSKFLEGEKNNDPTVDPDSNLPFCIPYNRNFEIDLSNVEISKSTLLGSGAYGMVFKGKMKDTGFPIAVKTLKPNADMMYFKSLLSELKVMIFIGEHENIVKLNGASTAEITSRKLYIFLEFCALGSMEFYLRDHRDDLKHLTKSKPTMGSDYQNLKLITEAVSETSSVRTPYSKYVNVPRNGESPDKLTMIDLIRFGYEISNAMDYLSDKKVVHGDVATRNCLLTENKKVKLTDFGLSRQVINYGTYVKTASSKQNPLPWRWLALETMKENAFSSKSDVWAFGITLWEIFSLAQVPYPGLTYSQDFIRMLEKGLRMNSPSDFTPPEIYRIMIDTWHAVPDERPTFAELKEKLLEVCFNTCEALKEQSTEKTEVQPILEEDNTYV